MDLSPAGHIVVRAGLVLFALGLFFLNMLVVLCLGSLFLLLLYQAISFRRRINVLRQYVQLESQPKTNEITVGKEFTIDTAIANESSTVFRFVELTPDLPMLTLKEGERHPQLSVQPHSKQRIATTLSPTSSGRFELLRWTAVVQDPGKLFRQRVSLYDRLTILAHPMKKTKPSTIDTNVLYDAAVDKIRRGRGTDLIGIRPFTLLDDFHRLDWKATARRGELMAREFYLERDPAVLLTIDATMEGKVRGTANSTPLLEQVTALLSSFRTSVLIGLILFDKRKVILSIEPTPGQRNRKRIIHELLKAHRLRQSATSSSRRPTNLGARIARETNTLKEILNTSSKSQANLDRMRMFSKLILPFYESSASKYVRLLREEGSFNAFEEICSLPSPVLVISITDGRANIDGLLEGAKKAMAMNHKVIISILGQLGMNWSTEVLSELERNGIRITNISTDGFLSDAISSEILAMSQSRTMGIRTAR